MFKYYLEIVKPGIIFGNLITTIGCFFFSSRGIIDFNLCIFTAVGISLVIASSCILNNFIDRDIDRKMLRTHTRVLAQGLISLKISLIYSIILGVTGFILLGFTTNFLVTFLAFIGFIIYVFIYSVYFKRFSVYSTILGSISGALPPVIGYCAVSNKFDSISLILMLIFILWQIPHFYAISIFRFQDYQSASIPTLAKIKGIQTTKKHIVFYIIFFIIAIQILYIQSYANYKYCVITTLISSYWLVISLKGLFSNFSNENNILWSRKIFICSIFVVTVLSCMLSIDSINL